MQTPTHVNEVFLAPGDYWFGGQGTRVRTLLGSCVAITLWHPKKLLGGMCHYMLPERLNKCSIRPDGKYADEVFSLLLQEIAKAETRLQEYEIKMFGGGDMFPSTASRQEISIGSKNVEAGQQLLMQHGISCKVTDVEGVGHRTVMFDIWSGHVWVRRGVVVRSLPSQCENCQDYHSCRG